MLGDVPHKKTGATTLHVAAVGGGGQLAAHGTSAVINLLLLLPGVLGDVPHQKTGATALHVAAAKGYIKVISLLIQAGAQVNTQVLPASHNLSFCELCSVQETELKAGGRSKCSYVGICPVLTLSCTYTVAQVVSVINRPPRSLSSL